MERLYCSLHPNGNGPRSGQSRRMPPFEIALAVRLNDRRVQTAAAIDPSDRLLFRYRNPNTGDWEGSDTEDSDSASNVGRRPGRRPRSPSRAHFHLPRRRRNNDGHRHHDHGAEAGIPELPRGLANQVEGTRHPGQVGRGRPQAPQLEIEPHGERRPWHARDRESPPAYSDVVREARRVQESAARGRRNGRRA